MITIEQPALVLNAVTNPQIARYQMWNTGDVPSTKPSQEVIGWIRIVAGSAPGGKLKNVIIQCHGAPGYLAIGQGFSRSNVGLFRGVSGLVDKIWVVACRPAFIDTSCGS